MINWILDFCYCSNLPGPQESVWQFLVYMTSKQPVERPIVLLGYNLLAFPWPPTHVSKYPFPLALTPVCQSDHPWSLQQRAPSLEAINTGGCLTRGLGYPHVLVLGLSLSKSTPSFSRKVISYLTSPPLV